MTSETEDEPPNIAVNLLYQAWSDLDRAAAGLSDDEATSRIDGHSAIAWTVAHASTYVDAWINVRFQGLAPNEVLSNRDFLTGGSGDGPDWASVRSAIDEVRIAARRFLDRATEQDLDRSLPFHGLTEFLREKGFRLRYALVATAVHHWVHVGEIRTVRSRLGGSEPPEDDAWGRSFA